jgi:hypothetical protein
MHVQWLVLHTHVLYMPNCTPKYFTNQCTHAHSNVAKVHLRCRLAQKLRKCTCFARALQCCGCVRMYGQCLTLYKYLFKTSFYTKQIRYFILKYIPRRSMLNQFFYKKNFFVHFIFQQKLGTLCKRINCCVKTCVVLLYTRRSVPQSQ